MQNHAVGVAQPGWVDSGPKSLPTRNQGRMVRKTATKCPAWPGCDDFPSDQSVRTNGGGSGPEVKSAGAFMGKPQENNSMAVALHSLTDRVCNSGLWPQNDHSRSHFTPLKVARKILPDIFP